MDTRVSKTYYLIPIFYIGLIGALLYFQFGRQEPFRLRIGFMDVEGHVLAGRTSPPALANVTLHANGLVFSFSHTTPVQVTTSGGAQQSVSLRSYSTIPNGIDITFTSGLALRFVAGGGESDTLSITPSTPAGVDISSVSFPYGIATGDRTRSGTGIPALAVMHDAPDGPHTFVLALPFNSEIRTADQRLVMVATGGIFGPARYGPANSSNQDPVAYWFEQNGRFPDAAQYAKQVGAYLDKAWSGWTQSRFDARNGTWQMRNGSPAFEESIVTALLAEALTRGSYATWLPAMRQAAAHHPQDINLETTPYFGNLVQTYKAYLPVFARELESDRRQLRDAAHGAPAIPGLLAFLTDHAALPEAQSLLAKMKAAEGGNVTLPVAIALLSDNLEAERLGYTGNGFAASATRLIDRVILPAIIRTKSGFFLHSEPGIADVASSVFAGSLLIEAGTRASRPLVADIGRELVLSALALSDAEGFLPGRLTITGDSVAGSEGFLAPEQIYPSIAPRSYYPREISLAAELGAGAWVWGTSHIVSVSAAQNEVAITFSFPAGATEYLVLHGIKPFSGIRLYGIPWHADPAFEQYRAGWVYDAADETLFVKLQHQTQNETIDILY